MGRPKALLSYGRTSFSRSIVAALQNGGADHTCVVVGHDPGPIMAHLCEMGVSFVYNRQWPKGQLTSLQAAIRACPPGSTGHLMALVDQPGLRPSTIRRMILRHRRDPRKILIASYQGRAGHPVVFPRRFFKDLLAAPLSEGARAVVRVHAAERVFVPTHDPAVVRDIDEVGQYRGLTR